MAVITNAGAALIAQSSNGEDKATRFILANVPGLDPDAAIDTAAGKPPAGQIVLDEPVTRSGYVNQNLLVYSLMMDSEKGPFTFNWMGLETANGKLLAVHTLPATDKRVGVGNNMTRNFALQYDGAQGSTGITVAAETWQLDYSARLNAMDLRQAATGNDTFGDAVFFGDGYKVQRVNGLYQVQLGVGYVRGIRVDNTELLTVGAAGPTAIWLDVSLQGGLGGSEAITELIVTDQTLTDETTSNGIDHYRCKLADIAADETVMDQRPLLPASVLNDGLAAWLNDTINNLGFLVTAPAVTGDTEQSYGSAVTLTASGSVSAWHNTSLNTTIDHYEWTLPDNSTQQGASPTYTVANDPALEGTILLFSVVAVDELGHRSEPVEHSVSVVGNQMPRMNGFTHSVPTIMVRNDTQQVDFSGATDPDGDSALITYSITGSVGVTASKSAGIGQGEQINLTVLDIAGDQAGSITVKPIDQAGTEGNSVIIGIELRHSAAIMIPVGQSPADSQNDVAQAPVLTGNPFNVIPAGFDAHAASQWQVATDSGFTNVVWDSLEDAANLTAVQVGNALALDTPHFWRVRYKGAALGWTFWSAVKAFHTVTAELPQNVFSTTLYTGNGANQTISNGVDLDGEGGLLWIKCRDTAYQPSHNLYDSTRDTGYRISTDSNNGQDSNGSHTFTDDGFSLDANSDNYSGKTYAAWAFRKAPKFFDVVTWTGDGSSRLQVAHSLGILPGHIMIKRLDVAANWRNYHNALAANEHLSVSQTSAASTSGVMFESPPDESNFYVGNQADVNAIGGQYIAYLFAHDPSPNGVIQCGKWDAYNEQVSLGWTPQFLLFKDIDNSSDWIMMDTERGLDNDFGTGDPYLRPNLPHAEFVAANGPALTADGFKAGNGWTPSVGPCVYVAIRAPIPV